MTTTTAPIRITNPLPPSIIAMDANILEHAATLVAKAELVGEIATSDALRDAETVYSQITALTKEIDQARLEIKRPILALGKQLDEAAGEALAPLAIQRTALRTRMDTYIKAENERRRKEAEEAQARLRAEQAERQKREAEERERIRQAEAMANPADAPMPGEEPTVIVPTLEPLCQVKAVELKSSVVKKVNRKVLVIDDASKIPRELLDPNTKKIDALLRAGIAVPGCRLDVEPGMADK